MGARSVALLRRPHPGRGGRRRGAVPHRGERPAARRDRGAAGPDREQERGRVTDNAQPPHMVYAYAVLRPTPEAARAVAAVRGVADEQVGLVETGDLAAAVGPVPAEEFEENALRAGLERLPRLAALARGHHGVV
ncbi:gas vesicle protein, partial [Streptomyces sp. SID8361]|nr:gas vesicle protein [Streptomyces sp. SID8361]